MRAMDLQTIGVGFLALPTSPSHQAAKLRQIDLHAPPISGVTTEDMELGYDERCFWYSAAVSAHTRSCALLESGLATV